MPKQALTILNAATATFTCTYGRGCAGVCCQNGRPGLYPDEQTRIEKNLKKFLPHLRPRAAAIIAKSGVVSKRKRADLPLVPVVDGWCVFFNEGCVLHQVGATEGDKYKYKPMQCSLFPLLQDQPGQWYVRQWKYKGEPWDLFCLNPANSPETAVNNLAEEIEIAAKYEKKYPTR